jgi:hypothetical protein
MPSQGRQAILPGGKMKFWRVFQNAPNAKKNNAEL